MLLGWPLTVILGVYWHCELYESNCYTERQQEEQNRAETNKAEKRPDARRVANKKNPDIAQQKPVESKTPSRCSSPCNIVKESLRDPVAFFNAFLVFIVYM